MRKTKTQKPAKSTVAATTSAMRKTRLVREILQLQLDQAASCEAF
jgi:hypothetical protein